jgi:hypothetical protein
MGGGDRRAQASDGNTPLLDHGEQRSDSENDEDEPPIHFLHSMPVVSAALLRNRLEPHNVVATIYIQDFPGDAGTGVGSQEDAR